MIWGILIGILIGVVLDRASFRLGKKLAGGGTKVARDARKKVLAEMDHDKLKQLETDIAAELERRRS